jgi:hypothetical protein
MFQTSLTPIPALPVEGFAGPLIIDRILSERVVAQMV